MIRLQEHAMTKDFSAVSLRPGALPMGHVMNVDHFRMGAPTFPPHPHAGFSAVTWMLPWSPGTFRNRDSLGDSSLITPGALHWTMAGAGMMHEEIPASESDVGLGLQIFVKLFEEHELQPPQAHHVAPDDVPRVQQGTSSARVLVGALGAVRAAVPDHHPGTTLLHVSAADPFTFDVPAGVDAFALALRGSGSVGDTAVSEHTALSLRSGPLTVRGTPQAPLELLVGFSPALPRAPLFRGPFCMFSAERLNDAAARFRAGGMGSLQPSPVRFSPP